MVGASGGSDAGDNMMTMMMMNVLDVLYPLLSDDLEDEALATKKSMLLAILSSFSRCGECVRSRRIRRLLCEERRR